MYKHEDLKSAFFKMKRTEYPDMSYQEMINIVNSPWRYFHTLLSGSTYYEIRVKYFGTFKMFPLRIKDRIKHLENRIKINGKGFRGDIAELEKNKILLKEVESNKFVKLKDRKK